MTDIKKDGVNQGDLVTLLTNVVTIVNELKASVNATMTKLDSDAGVTDANYSSTNAVDSSDLSLTGL